MNIFAPKGSVKEVKGNVLTPQNNNLALIFIPCSATGSYKSTIYSQATKKWSKVNDDYRTRFVCRDNFKLGELIVSYVAPDMWVVQALCLTDKNKMDKAALIKCVAKTVDLAKYEKAYIHVSNITFKEFPTIKKQLVDAAPPVGIHVFCYEADEPELFKR